MFIACGKGRGNGEGTERERRGNGEGTDGPHGLSAERGGEGISRRQQSIPEGDRKGLIVN